MQALSGILLIILAVISFNKVEDCSPYEWTGMFLIVFAVLGVFAGVAMFLIGIAPLLSLIK